MHKICMERYTQIVVGQRRKRAGSKDHESERFSSERRLRGSGWRHARGGDAARFGFCLCERNPLLCSRSMSLLWWRDPNQTASGNPGAVHWGIWQAKRDFYDQIGLSVGFSYWEKGMQTCLMKPIDASLLPPYWAPLPLPACLCRLRRQRVRNPEVVGINYPTTASALSS